jgi:transposase
MEKNSNVSVFSADFLAHLQPYSAGIDVGASFHYVAVPPSLSTTPVRSFATHSAGLEDLAQWLVSLGIKTVALESTGVYWMPLYEVLENHGLQVFVANARYVRNVPGRKTDVEDSRWLQQLHSVGLLHASFVPEAGIRELRTYLRFRNQCVIEKVTQINRMEKALQQLNIKLKQVISKLDTQVAMGIIRSIVAGERNGAVLASTFYNYRMKASQEDLALALQGNWKPEYLFTLTQALVTYDFYHQQVMLSEEKIEAVLQNFTQTPPPNLDLLQADTSTEIGINQEVIAQETPQKVFESRQKNSKVRQNDYHFEVKTYLRELFGIDLTAITGLSENTVLSIIGEVGIDLARWKTAKHFVSWLGLAPQPKISGGKVIGSFRKRMTNQATESFRMAAYSLHSAQSALGQLYRKMAAKKGSAVAIKTVARKIAIIFYQMIQTKTEFDPTRQQTLKAQQEQQRIKWLAKQAKACGMTLVPINTTH